MSEFQSMSERLAASLSLSVPPVAMTFSDTPPDGVSAYSGMAPAGCSFWEAGARATFVTSASDHALCSIGIHTHNLSGAPAAQPGELQSTLEAMTGIEYVTADEVAAIPVAGSSRRHVVYGPLAESTSAPDVVLVFAHTQQGLVLSEATARVDGALPLAMGRPACAVVPQVLGQGNAAMSLGCCGARAYLDGWSDSIALWALPGGKLAAYCEQVEVLARANGVLTTFHAGRRNDVDAGVRPSVADSLAKLG